MIKRENYLSRIRGFYESDLVKILVGIRRCGKSVILNQIIDELKESGCDDNHIIYINFEYIEYEELKDYKNVKEFGKLGNTLVTKIDPLFPRLDVAKEAEYIKGLMQNNK